MYEIVLMAAMTTTPQVADRGGRHCRCSCSCGCYCGCYCSGYCGGYVAWCGGGCACSGVRWGCGGMQGERVGPPKKKTKEEEVSAPAPATLIVSLPPGAQLRIDDRVITSSQRVFLSPPLERGYDYTYTLRATVQRNGQPASTTQQVTVRAGETTRVNLEVPAVSTAAASD